MKVNKLGMLIKFAAFYLCINFIVVSALPVDEKHGASVESDYDAMPDKATEETSSDTKPPLVFPSDDEKSTSKNDTALEILQKNSETSVINKNSTATNVTKDDEKDYDEKETGSDKTAKDEQKDEKPKKDEDKAPKKDSEDVNKDKKEESNKDKKEEPNKDKKEDSNKDKKEEPNSDKKDPTKDKEEPSKDKDYDEYENSKETSGDDKDDAENIQENQDQGDLEERYGVNSTSINVFEEPTLKSGHIAFIFAASLVFLSATAYVGLVLWRKSLERRYGMRQRLVTEDDYYNNNDVRFFGL